MMMDAMIGSYVACTSETDVALKKSAAGPLPEVVPSLLSIAELRPWLPQSPWRARSIGDSRSIHCMRSR